MDNKKTQGYEKPVLTKHVQLKEITLSSTGGGGGGGRSH